MDAKINPLLSRFKTSFATRRVDLSHIHGIDTDAADITAGDLVIAEVVQIGHHTKIEQPDGRRAALHAGDHLLLASAARYAPDQFEADCPTAVGPAHLAAAGGIAGLVRTRHGRTKTPTQLNILGTVLDRNGKLMNLNQYAVSAPSRPMSVPIVAVCGTSMNSGKTHTVASLVRGFALAGHKPAAVKVTGTGAGGDLWAYTDSGAHIIRDFTDAGFATTYQASVPEIFDGMLRLASEVTQAGADVIVMELADGLLQQETAQLLQMDRFRRLISSVVFAATDAFGAESGIAWLRNAGYPVCALSGCLTRSPLAMREAATLIDIPCLTPADLQRAETVGSLARFSSPLRMPAAA